MNGITYVSIVNRYGCKLQTHTHITHINIIFTVYVLMFKILSINRNDKCDHRHWLTYYMLGDVCCVYSVCLKYKLCFFTYPCIILLINFIMNVLCWWVLDILQSL